jgi:hypothetical protein
MLTLVLGIVGLVIGLWMWSLSIMGHQLFILFVKALLAVIPVMLVFGGIVAVIAGISSIREKAADKKEENTAQK